MQQIWHSWNQSRLIRIGLIVVGIVLSLYYFPIINVDMVYLILINAIALICLIMAIKFYYNPFAILLIFITLICFSLLNIIIFLISSIVFTFLVFSLSYNTMERRRLKKIEFYAKTRPTSIADVSKPRITVFIRGKK